MNSCDVGRVRKGLLVSLAAACFVISGAQATTAQAKEAKDPTANRGRRGGGRKKGQDGQGAAARKKRGPAGVIRLAGLTSKKLEELYGKLDTDSSGTVSLEEFKALPKVMQKLAKEAADKAKARGSRKKPGQGAKDPTKKRGGRRKKKGPNAQ